MRYITLLSFWVLMPVVLAAVVYLIYRVAVGRRSSERLFSQPDAVVESSVVDSPMIAMLRRWLFLAGYREFDAPAKFIMATLAAAFAGGGVLLLIQKAGLTEAIVGDVRHLPAGLGDIFLPIFALAPWLAFVTFALMPSLIVRAARRTRIEQIEQDLPISLELLSTLSEAGLGFDAALARVLESVMQDRPLEREFRSYQADLLAGRSRSDALRRLARRIEVASVTILISALVQAEQLGTGISHALRWQAEDLRSRRRERANAFAMALPVKRMFPLVVCYMPGIFVWTLGPFFVQLFEFADTFVKVRHFVH